ncbi:hypothetical protein [Thalassospira sp.]|uniref:hypothetical protein n=1 Tax=Thalassospira sp. TaxID=1912094 RepID=UPI002613D221|nr:hypothetical protein [Thalassospira sp.]MCH2276906.1 hypothetical protein [Thalassospira sp.]
MDTADFALALASGSFVIATLSLGWNIWSKFIFPKPHVQVGASIMRAMSRDGEFEEPALHITVTNHGPAEVVIYAAIGKSSNAGKQDKTLVLNPYNQYPYDLDSSGPFSGGLPKRLIVGETFSLAFPVVKDWFETEKMQRLGVSDTFNRMHWVKDSQFISLRNKVLAGRPDGVEF